MGTNVVQCLDCGQWNWEGVEKCASCGSGNLTIGFHQYLAYFCSIDPQLKQDIENIYNKRGETKHD